jgi:hypothetical protein
MRPAFVSVLALVVVGCSANETVVDADAGNSVEGLDDSGSLDPTDGAFGGQPVSPAIAFRRYQVIAVSDGISAGFNLDGLVSADEGSDCGGSDGTASDGTPGIDNGVGRLWTDFYEVLGEPLQSLFQESVSRGGDIPVLAFPAGRPPRFAIARFNGAQVDFDGLLAGYQTFDVEQPDWQIDLVQTDNELMFGPSTVEVHIEVFMFYIPVLIEQFQGALHRGTDGIWRGTVGGLFPTSVLPEALGGVSSLRTGELLLDALTRQADMPEAERGCTRISFAAEVEAVEAFAVLPPSP